MNDCSVCQNHIFDVVKHSFEHFSYRHGPVKDWDVVLEYRSSRGSLIAVSVLFHRMKAQIVR
jgi:hypothetical protein